MTDRERATRERAELRGVAVLNLQALGHDATDSDLIAARGCLRELA